MWGTPEGYKFRQYINCWEDARNNQERRNQIQILLDGQNFVLFFKCGGDVYAAHEPHRVTFARMKNPDKETTDGWIAEANFVAFNLTKSLSGNPTQRIFYKKDLDGIKIIKKEEASENLYKTLEKLKPDDLKANARQVIQMSKDDDEEPGVPINQEED